MLAFLDTETTGLDHARHQAWAVAYSLDGGPIQTHALPHTIDGADPEALRINGYHQHAPRLGPPAADVVEHLRRDLTGVTIVGANPRFDAAMLANLLGDEPWSYRLVDVCAAVMYLEGWPEPKGLRGCAYAMRSRGIRVPIPDHTAAGDVATVMGVHSALRELHAAQKIRAGAASGPDTCQVFSPRHPGEFLAAPPGAGQARS